MKEHFRLNRSPFGRDVPIEALYPGAAHQEGLARLTYAATHRKVMLLTGEVGAGKSTLLRALEAKLDATTHQVVYLAEPALTPRGLYQQLLEALRVEAPFQTAKAKRLAQNTLLERFRHQKTTVLVIDEAQQLELSVLEEVRSLLNFEFDSTSPFALVISGSTALGRRLQMQSLEALAQRIELRFHLGALQPAESAAYVRHHLQAAGAQEEIFTDEALTRLHQITGGIPRKLNQAATTALMAAEANERHTLDDGFIDQLAPEFQGLVHEGGGSVWRARST